MCLQSYNFIGMMYSKNFPSEKLFPNDQKFLDSPLLYQIINFDKFF